MASVRMLVIVATACFTFRTESKRSTLTDSSLAAAQDVIAVSKDGMQIVVVMDTKYLPDIILNQATEDLMASLREKTGLEITYSTHNKTVDASGKPIVISDPYHFYLLPALQTCSYEFSQAGSKLSKRLCLVITGSSFKCRPKDANETEEQRKLCSEKPEECSDFAACNEYIDTFVKTELAEDFFFIAVTDNVKIPHMQDRLADPQFNKFLANGMDCKVGGNEMNFGGATKREYNVDGCDRFFVEDTLSELADKVENSVEKLVVNVGEELNNGRQTTTSRRKSTSSDKNSTSRALWWFGLICAMAMKSLVD